MSPNSTRNHWRNSKANQSSLDRLYNSCMWPAINIWVSHKIRWVIMRVTVGRPHCVRIMVRTLSSSSSHHSPFNKRREIWYSMRTQCTYSLWGIQNLVCMHQHLKRGEISVKWMWHLRSVPSGNWTSFQSTWQMILGTCKYLMWFGSITQKIT